MTWITNNEAVGSIFKHPAIFQVFENGELWIYSSYYRNRRLTKGEPERKVKLNNADHAKKIVEAICNL